MLSHVQTHMHTLRQTVGSLIINSGTITLTLLLPLRSTRMFPGNIMHIYSYIPALRNATVNVSVSNEAISLCFSPHPPPEDSISCLTDDIPEIVPGWCLYSPH